MIRNYITIAIRNIRKHSFYSAINIFGLAAGVTACLFIILYISDEFSYDHFHKEAVNIYRIGLHGKIAGQEINTASSCPPLASSMVANIPGVEAATRVNKRDNMVFKNGDLSFTEDKILFADSNFFQFFSFELLEGDPATALKDPNSIVLTPDLASKYFKGPALGKLLTIGNENKTFKVTGIAAASPHNSHFSFTALLSTSSEKEQYDSPIWLNNNLYTYFRKTPTTPLADIARKLNEVTDKHVGPEVEQFMGISMEKFRESGSEYGYVPFAMLDSRLHSNWNDDMEPSGNITYIYVFAAVGVFILLIACINFMNLATARSAGRAKEVGLRKTLGSLRGQMVRQFLAESLVYGFIAVALALMLTGLLLPQFNLLSGKQLSFLSLLSPSIMAGAFGLILIIGLLAGSYPAFYLTSFSAVEVLKGKVRAGLKSKGIRSGLVIFQFSLSIILIICTSTVYQQIQYLQERNAGLDKHNVLAISNTGRLGTNQMAFKNTMLTKAGIENASFTNNVFPGVNNTTAFRDAVTKKDHIMGTYYADQDHADVLKFELVAGRYFSRDFPSDSMAVVLNEAAVRELSWDNPLQEKLITFGGDQSKGIVTEIPMNVIGVVKDFNFESYKVNVRPMVIQLTEKSYDLLIRYSGEPGNVVKEATQLWREYASGDPFEYAFLDQNFDELFREEERLGSLFTIFTLLAIVIASLGLFALAAFTAEQRTKEIGIRKAMGASVTGITKLLSKEFTLLVLVSIVLAVVPSYFLLDYWLSQFAYRVEITFFIFVVSSLGALFIAWITVGFQAFKAALIKPVDSLRCE